MTGSAIPPVDWLQLVSSFLLVLGLLAIVLVFLKRVQGPQAGRGRQIELLETFSTGARQRLMLVRVKDREFLLGSTMSELNCLAEWPASATSPQSTDKQVGLAGRLPTAQALGQFLKRKP